jgi:hypothetical protein
MNNRLAVETSPIIAGRSSAEFSSRVKAMPATAHGSRVSFLA